MSTPKKLREEVAGAPPDVAPPEAASLRELLRLREHFQTGAFAELEGVASPYTGPIFKSVLDALDRVKTVTEDPRVRKFALKQLRLNELQFEEHALEHGVKELADVSGSDAANSIYSVAKVDSHLHLSACMTTAELYDYLGEIYRKHGDRVLDEATGTTIKEMMSAEGFTPGGDLDAMGTMSNKVMLRNFEDFNQAFQPMRSKKLKNLVFKMQTLDGEFLRGYITRVVDKAAARNTFLEPRISIKGTSRSEWETLAKWVHAHRESTIREHLLWAVQLPRVYHVWHGRRVQSFGELVTNFFGPLFDATSSPEAHVELAWFLEHCGMIDTVDNEDKVDAYDLSTLPPASEYTNKDNPPYGYYHFFWWANLKALNKLRAEKGMRILTLRPHCGEAGPVHHLSSAFLFAHNISHGINLAKEPTLEYLYYLAQIGLSVSPISNKALFIPYTRNPFATLYKRGLRATLTTDDPLMFHMTDSPLLEEYAAARLVWELTLVDLCEIAHHSVHISSLPEKLKERLGSTDVAVSNVPPSRWAFRARVRQRNEAALTGQSEKISPASSTRVGPPGIQPTFR